MQVQIKEFTGPLDVLLQLIRREEMDILDIDVHKITDQYLNFINSQSAPDLHFAGDFIKMAAILIYIKSKSLLPSDSEEESSPEEDPEEDLKASLTISLLRMQAVQSISQYLNRRPLLGRDIWPGAGDSMKAGEQTDSSLNNVQATPLLSLLKAYHNVQEKKSLLQKTSTALPEKDNVIIFKDSLHSIYQRLKAGQVFRMSSLLKDSGGSSLSGALAAFLSLLELSRRGIVNLFQIEDFSDVEVSVKKSVDKKEILLTQNTYTGFTSAQSRTAL